MSDTDSDIIAEGAFYRKKLLLSMLIPGIFVILMWLVKIVEILFELDFSEFGIFPLTVKGLKGILFSPFIHADFKHLFNNSLPLFFLSTALFYFYSEVAHSFLPEYLSGWLEEQPGISEQADWYTGLRHSCSLVELLEDISGS